MKPNKILVVDDEPVICTGCRLVLFESGYEVDVCGTYREGIDRILTGSYDLVLLDIKLPDTDGMQMLRKLRDEKPQQCVVVMTGYATVQNAVEVMRLGAIDYLPKPFTADELISAVEKAVDKAKRLPGA